MGFNLLDISIIVILVISVIIGYRRGFIRTIGGIISTLAGLGIAFLYRNEAAAYLQEHYGVVSTLTAFLEKRMSIPATGFSQPGLLSLPVNQGLAFVHRQFTELAYLIVVTLCFLLLYIISSCLLKFSCAILEKVLCWGILKEINHSGGIGVVLAQNVIIMAVIMGVLNSPLGLGTKMGIKSVSQMTASMHDSVLVPYLLKIFTLLHSMLV